jgi:hypothetical protein
MNPIILSLALIFTHLGFINQESLNASIRPNWNLVRLAPITEQVSMLESESTVCFTDYTDISCFKKDEPLTAVQKKNPLIQSYYRSYKTILATFSTE